MNLKRGRRLFWSLSGRVHRHLYRDPVALVYLDAAERLGAQLRWKEQQQQIRAERRAALDQAGAAALSRQPAAIVV